MVGSLLLLYICLYWRHFCYCNFHVSNYSVITFAWRNSFISCKTGFKVLNCFSFCVSVHLLSPHQIRMKALLGRVFVIGVFLSFHHFKYIVHSLLVFRVSAEKSADHHMGVPFISNVVFPLLLLIFSFSLIFVILIMMCLGVVFFGLMIFRPLCFLKLEVHLCLFIFFSDFKTYKSF